MGPLWATPYSILYGVSIWDPYGTHLGKPLWACPDIAHMGPIYACLLGYPGIAEVVVLSPFVPLGDDYPID